MMEMMPKEQSDFIEEVRDKALESFNMDEHEAWDFAFRVWQGQDFLRRILKAERPKPAAFDPFEGMRIVIQSYATNNGRRETSWRAKIDGQDYGSWIEVYDTSEDLWKSIEVIADQARRSIEEITGTETKKGEPLPRWRGNMDGLDSFQTEEPR